MNVVTRGIKNALRSPLRTGAIVIMLAISIALIMSMLVARSSVNAKINDVKASAGTGITVSPAGISGFGGGGDPLSAAQVATISSTAHVSSTASTLIDQMGSTDTNLTSSLTLGSFGQRQQRFEAAPTEPTGSSTSTTTTRPARTPRTTLTGTTNPNSVATNGGTLTLTSGSLIDGNSTALEALVGSDLAAKNSLSIGSTFTAYTQTVTVKGIYKTGNAFADSGVIMPLASVQTLTAQPGAVTSVIATVDSSDNVDSVVTALKASLGDKADVTSQAAQAAASVASLASIATLATSGVIGAAIAGAIIMLLSMIIIVRERRREIGVIKAIGATNGKVIVQFVSEAMTLTVLGAIVGVLFGIFISGPLTSSLVTNQTAAQSSQTAGGPAGFIRGGLGRIGANVTQVTSSVTPGVFVWAISITFAIAIIGSAVPAWLIARIRPAEVLRTDG